ncbi:MAG: glycosyltransferase family 2 protein, partial [Erysipelotrichia bacterium]|nr:glycosyltransferase family 2 protein [Erysipelotrichia bacterium]
MKNDLVSIIIPVYNTVEYLEECINSVLGQTYKNIELWLIDDGSTDGSEILCDDFVRIDDRVKVIHKENEGQGVARNVALDRCSGKYVSFVDSDDIIKPNMIESMVNAIKENNADIALCGIAVNNGIRLHDVPVFDKAVCWDTKQLVKEYVTNPNIHTGPCNKVYKKTIFDGIRFPIFKANEDAYIMHLLLGRCKKAVHIGECMYIQNIRPNSTEQSPFSERKLALLDCAQSLIEYYKSNFPDLYKFVAYKKINDSAVLMSLIIESDHKKYKDIYNSIYTQMK